MPKRPVEIQRCSFCKRAEEDVARLTALAKGEIVPPPVVEAPALEEKSETAPAEAAAS